MPTPSEIRKAREQSGLTQAAAAVLVGVTRVTWARWESGITPPPSEALWRFWLHVAGIERIPFRQSQRPQHVSRGRAARQRPFNPA